MAEPTLTQRYQGLKDPGMILYYAIYFYIITFLTRIAQFRWPFPLAHIRDEAFSSFWLYLSAPPDPNTPLQGSAALIPALIAAASGTCLELGPGSGSLMQHFARNPSVRAVYGAEPSAGLHASLHTNARKEGMQERYHVLRAGAERTSLIPALAKEGLLQHAAGTDGGVFDTIVCVRVLCSVTQLVDTVDGVYDLLKPGGKLVVCEHVVNRWQGTGSVIARLFQLLYQMLGWTYFVGDCHMDREIGRVLGEAARKDGGWRQNGLEYYFEWSALPYVAGVLVKR